MAKNRPQDRRDGNMAGRMQEEPRQQGEQLRENLQKESSTKMQHAQQKARQSGGSQTSMKQKKGNRPR